MSPLGVGQATGRGVLVAVIDSGWNRALTDDRVRPGIGLVHPVQDFLVHYSTDDHDRLGHGTACARLVLEAAPEAEILPIRVFGGRLETSVELLQAALRCALERGAAVVNLSLATLRRDVIVPLYAACEEVVSGGAIVVAAAYRPTEHGYPAVFANAIGVEAGPVGGPLDFWYRREGAIECVADGTPIDRGRRGGSAGSNSFAAARIAGAVALCRERHPEAGLDAARRWLAEHAARRS